MLVQAVFEFVCSFRCYDLAWEDVPIVYDAIAESIRFPCAVNFCLLYFIFVASHRLLRHGEKNFLIIQKGLKLTMAMVQSRNIDMNSTHQEQDLDFLNPCHPAISATPFCLLAVFWRF